MLWIGLTGGIACGKSTVSFRLRQRGFAVVDADVLARDVVRAGTAAHAEIAREFGQDSIAETGELNREKIASVVFSDRSKLEKLESIIHPLVRARASELRRELAEQGVAVAFYDVPLLFEKNMQSMFDRIVVVTCRPELQLKRLIERNQMSVSEAKKRIASQLPLLQKEAEAHHVLRNDGNAEELEREIDRIINEMSLS